MVLIDTWWNVNLMETKMGTSYDMVLIDTWWNVNEVQFDFSRGYYTVLIDTWWNVNFLNGKVCQHGHEPF